MREELHPERKTKKDEERPKYEKPALLIGTHQFPPAYSNMEKRVSANTCTHNSHALESWDFKTWATGGEVF